MQCQKLKEIGTHFAAFFSLALFLFTGFFFFFPHVFFILHALDKRGCSITNGIPRAWAFLAPSGFAAAFRHRQSGDSPDKT